MCNKFVLERQQAQSNDVVFQAHCWHGFFVHMAPCNFNFQTSQQCKPSLVTAAANFPRYTCSVEAFHTYVHSIVILLET